MSRSNTAEQWGRLWRDAPSRLKELRFGVEKAEKSLIWSSIRESLGETDISSLSTIEIGAGAGTISAAFARNGARVTVLDYSKEALDVNAALFESFGLKQESLLADALNLPASLLGGFDVAMSFGLAEHFEADDRTRIIKAHFDLLRPGGLAVITVPNRHCWPYRMWKARRELTGKWHFGMEIPYSRAEISRICLEIGVKDSTSPARRFSRLSISYCRSPVGSVPLRSEFSRISVSIPAASFKSGRDHWAPTLDTRSC